MCLTAVRDLLDAVAGNELPLGSKFNHALYHLHETAFGPYHLDDALTVAPLAKQAERDGRSCSATAPGSEANL